MTTARVDYAIDSGFARSQLAVDLPLALDRRLVERSNAAVAIEQRPMRLAPDGGDQQPSRVSRRRD